MTERIDYDSKGNLDDVAVSDVSMFRLEYMDRGQIWIRLYRDDASDIVIRLSSPRKIKGMHEYD